ncbi:MAG: hypothetical protein K8I65_01030 [Thermoanaerobaculia bacterium]|nr:hypothetical protein [Thermoanaerobaculia bacterium]
MAKVVMSIPKLGVTNRGWEACKEIYVLSFTADLNPPSAPKVQEVIAAYNETLPNVAPAAVAHAGMNFLLTTASNVFPNVRADQPLSLSGSGILLYPNLDPNGLIANHFVIVESDEGKRDLGKLLDATLSDSTVSGAISVLQKAASLSQPLLATLMGAVVSRLPAILKKNKDEILFAHSHSGFDFDDYGANGGQVTEYQLGNDLANCTLRIRLN